MYYELSKKDKKTARICIDKGCDREMQEGLEQFEAILQHWRKGKFATNKEAYHALFKAVDKKDDNIAQRYDNLGGSKYLMAVASIYADGYISDEEIDDFSEEVKTLIKGFANGFK